MGSARGLLRFGGVSSMRLLARRAIRIKVMFMAKESAQASMQQRNMRTATDAAVACQPMLSVVMPVYNQEKVLQETLTSIACQTFGDYELLCIDDGSDDRSASIVEANAERDGRIHLFRRPHEGGPKARNFGLACAVGKYVMFLDSDDLFLPDFFASMVEALEATDADMCICESDFYQHQSGAVSSNYRFPVKYKEGLYARSDFGGDAFQIGGGWPWNKLHHRKRLLDCGATFQDVRSWDDCLFTVKTMRAANTVYLLRKPLVLYRRGLGTSLDDTRFHASADAVFVAEEIYRQVYEPEAFSDEEGMSLLWACAELLAAAARDLSTCGTYTKSMHELIAQDIHAWGIDSRALFASGRIELALKLALQKNATHKGVMWAYGKWGVNPSDKKHTLPQKVAFGTRIILAMIAGQFKRALAGSH